MLVHIITRGTCWSWQKTAVRWAWSHLRSQQGRAGLMCAALVVPCRQVFAVDILGQGSSWPVRPATPEDGLYLSIDVWRQQLRDFAEQVNGRSLVVPT